MAVTDAICAVNTVERDFLNVSHCSVACVAVTGLVKGVVPVRQNTSSTPMLHGSTFKASYSWTNECNDSLNQCLHIFKCVSCMAQTWS